MAAFQAHATPHFDEILFFKSLPEIKAGREERSGLLQKCNVLPVLCPGTYVALNLSVGQQSRMSQ